MASFIVPLANPEATQANLFGPKAANLALLGRAGLPIPSGYCVSADAYRFQLEALALAETARNVFSTEDGAKARRYALQMKLGLMERAGALVVVRSSALVEDRFGSSFAGQFESFIGIESEEDFITAVRSCWAALWSTRALRYMATHDADPAETAMALLIQPLVAAH